MTKLKYAGDLIEIAVEPRSENDRTALVSALEDLVADHADLTVETDGDTGQLLLKGQSEQQLEEVVYQLKTCGIEVQTGNPQIAYLESLMRPVTVEDTHHRSTSSPKDVARVVLRLEPLSPKTENVFVSDVFDASVSATHLAAIERTVRSFWREGPLLGLRMIGMKVSLLAVDGDDAHTSEMSVASATRAAFKDACKKGALRIFEPIMSVAVAVPEDFIGAIIYDITVRRGEISGQNFENGMTTIQCQIPLRNMFGYSITLRSMTDGRANFTMEYSHHELVPNNVTSYDPRNFPPAVSMRA